ncbi:hypothetical protein IEQ34_022076 [Dendrobium chrysotoxum]|uniref:Uncharacterized protein n=1 Tax=Dendrobium chrysotoxum TaxID=161865 RepID=A0AAV7FW44_DENCH|nr:hypothetical protein IEQ34_022076 [Dendrobium chrysotoxum]
MANMTATKEILGKDECMDYLGRDLIQASISSTTNARSLYEVRIGKLDNNVLVNIAEEKCYKFLRGLRDELRHPLVLLRIQNFSQLVGRVRLVENDLIILAFRHDMIKKRSREDMNRAK